MGEFYGREVEMTIKQAMRTVGVVLSALLLGMSAHATAYGQSDRADRPDSQEVRSPRRERATDTEETQGAPATVTERQTRKYGRTPKVNELKGIQTFGIAGSASGNQYQETFDAATADYQKFLGKFSNTAFANSHVRLRFDDFAPAYFIALNTQVGGKVSTGLELAEKRAQLRSYEKILREDVGLDQETAKRIEREAKQILKSFRK